MKNIKLYGIGIIMLFIPRFLFSQVKSYDLVVYGATASGIMASYAAAREGLKVAVLSDSKHVGGLTASGLGWVDVGMPETIGGYTLDFFKKVGLQYGSVQPAFKLTPLIAEQTFISMIKEAGVDIFYNSRIVEKTGAVVSNKRVEKIIL